MTTKNYDGTEYESINSFSSLKFGDDVLIKEFPKHLNVKFISYVDKSNIGNIGYFFSFNHKSYNLFRFSHEGIKSVKAAFELNKNLDSLSFEEASKIPNWYYRRITDPDIYVLKNRSKDNDYAPGIHVCKCAFMNKDVATSSIVNGKYTCRQCRLIWV